LSVQDFRRKNLLLGTGIGWLGVRFDGVGDHAFWHSVARLLASTSTTGSLRIPMAKNEYHEGPKALEKFHDGMKKLFQAPKPAKSPFKPPAKPKPTSKD